MMDPSNRYQQFTILYVDDEAKALKYFERAFRNEFCIITAASVDIALEILTQKSEEIGVLITDQRMPGKSGTELLKLARRDYPDIVRLLTTAYSDLDTAIEAVNRGEVFRYINKPWELTNLRMDLRNALDFFDLRRERNFLIQEKLNVRYRMKQSERIRDFVIMAASFTQIRYPLHAIDAFLSQIPFDMVESEGAQNINWAALDLWSHLEQESERMLTIAQSTIQQTRADATQPFDFSTEGYLKPLLNNVCQNLKANDQQVCVNILEEAPSLRMNEALLHRMFTMLIEKVSAATEANGTIEVATESEHQENRVSLSITSTQITQRIEDDVLFTSAQNSEAAHTEFLSAFFICYHHGGSLNITTNDPSKVSITIVLPLDPSSIKLPPLDEYWLEQILARLEA